MKKLLLLTTLSSGLLLAQFNYNISSITPEVKERMLKANSWRPSCPVPLMDLRYINVNHLNFEGETVSGEIIVHKDVADDVVNIFAELYEIGYPIRQMRLVSDFNADDWASIEADNTSAFNCRPVTGKKKKWSKHAYGKAIDINPIENPYISKRGHISHKASLKYRKRIHKVNTPEDRATLLKNDSATKIFKKYGWKWGGDWYTIKDYQHFVKK
jgi:hypothetical protein